MFPKEPKLGNTVLVHHRSSRNMEGSGEEENKEGEGVEGEENELSSNFHVLFNQRNLVNNNSNNKCSLAQK